MRAIPRRTVGSAYDAQILRLALPALGALVAEPLFLLGDSAIVGRLGTRPLAGLGVAGSALATLVSACIFLAYATTAAVGRRLGAGDRSAALRRGVDGIWLGAGLGVALALAGWPAVPAVVDALGASAAVTPYAETYLRVSLVGIPGMLVVLAATGSFRGLQDTRTPLLVAGVASVVNLGLNATFVLGLGWGIGGSALGTALVQLASAAAYVVLLARPLRRAGVPLGPSLRGITDTAVAGGHLVVRTVALRAVFVTATAVAARLGDADIAAHQVAFAIWSLLALALDAIAIAGQAIVSHQLGAGAVGDARAITRRMLGWGILGGAVLGAVLLAVRPLLPALFTPAHPVRALLGSVLVVVALQQPINGVVFVLDGVLIGAGDLRYLAAAGVGTALVFLPAAYAVLLGHAGLVALWWALSLFMLARLIALSTRIRGNGWLRVGVDREPPLRSS